MDCTGSMGSYIASAQANIKTIIEHIQSTEKTEVRFGLIEYRDHPPQDSTFVTRVHQFSSSITTMREAVNACSASGGGDGPEVFSNINFHKILHMFKTHDIMKK